VAETPRKNDKSGVGGPKFICSGRHKIQNQYWMKFRTARNEATGFEELVEGNVKLKASKPASSVFVPPYASTAGYFPFFGSAKEATSGCLTPKYLCSNKRALQLLSNSASALFP